MWLVAEDAGDGFAAGGGFLFNVGADLFGSCEQFRVAAAGVDPGFESDAAFVGQAAFLYLCQYFQLRPQAVVQSQAQHADVAGDVVVVIAHDGTSLM